MTSNFAGVHQNLRRFWARSVGMVLSGEALRREVCIMSDESFMVSSSFCGTCHRMFHNQFWCEIVSTVYIGVEW